MLTVGGVISGYCATESFVRATSPMMTSTMEMTMAKTGRSTKKRANIGTPLPSARSTACPGRLFRPGHAYLVGPDLHPVAHPLDAVDDDPVARLEPVPDHQQPVLEPAGRDVPAL